MTGRPDWKELLREPNALGWIAFMAVVVIIGIGSLVFMPGSPRTSGSNPVAITQAR